MPQCVFPNSPARPVTQTVCQDAQASESANLGKTCKYGVASAAVAADDVADATAAVIATDADDTVDVANSINASEHCNYRTTASDN